MRLRNARDVGALVRDRRRDGDLSQQALADEAGVSRRWLASLEAGKPGAEIGMVLRVLSALGVELESGISAVAVPMSPEHRGGALRQTGLVDLDALVEGYGTRRG